MSELVKTIIVCALVFDVTLLTIVGVFLVIDTFRR